MYDPGTKGHQAELCHLEALQSKGNANDSHTEQKTNDHIGYRQFNASDKDPYEIYKKRYCTHTIIGHFFPKGKKLQSRHFEALDPYWDSNDGHRPQKTKKEPHDRRKKTSQ